MTPTVVEEEDERDEDNISTDVDDDNVQGAGALPNTVSVNFQKAQLYALIQLFRLAIKAYFVIIFLILGHCDTS